MKIVVLTVAAVAILAAPALAESKNANAGPTSVQEESKGIFTSILTIVVKWIFPVCAAYCFLYGIIGKGVKRGEWDMAAICTVSAIALALFPKLLSALFGVSL